MLKLLALWPNSGQCVGLPDSEKYTLFHEITIGLWLFCLGSAIYNIRVQNKNTFKQDRSL